MMDTMKPIFNSKLGLLSPRIPLELRLEIYDRLLEDLIDELSDNLFAVYQFYDHVYDYTASYLESHVGKTGLTNFLLTNRQIYAEALPRLCDHAEFVVTVLGGEDERDEERANFRFARGIRHLDLARKMKVNFAPAASGLGMFLSRVRQFLQMIQNGENLRCLEVIIDPPTDLDSQSLDQILTQLEVLRIVDGRPIHVYLREVTEEQLSNERFARFLDAING